MTARSEESDYDSSCSSITTRDSAHGWVSDVSFGSSSSLSVCSYADSAASLCSSHKPHKANQAHWQAMARIRRASGRIGLEHFQLLRRLGSGDIGNVYLCRLRNPVVGLPECLYAMKVVDREALAIRNKLQRAEMEKEILGMLDHPFVPTLYDQFNASRYSCLVMEFCPGGDLLAVRQRQPGKCFSVSSAKFYVAETLLALEYLHMMGVVYRDLKPENVLVREDGHIMLSDFDLSLKCDVVPTLLKTRPDPGAAYLKHASSKHSIPACAGPIQPVLSCFSAKSASKQTKDNKAASSRSAAGEELELQPELVAEPVNARSKSFVGTHEYLAPEVISGSGHGSAVDWWTLGVFLYELLFGRTPFKGENNERTLMNILKKPLTFPKIDVSSMGSTKELEEMLKAQDLISRLLVKNPKKRIGSLKGSVEIKRHEFFKGVNWALIRSVKPPQVPRDMEKMRKRVGQLASSKVHKRDRGATYQIPQHFDCF
ncbi:Protein kinase PINOID [Asimina triloba]